MRSWLDENVGPVLAVRPPTGSTVRRPVVAPRRRKMPAVAEYFQSGSRNWQARLAISVDLMARAESVHRPGPKRIRCFAPTDGSTVPHRPPSSACPGVGWSRPAFRVTRFNLWEESANPFRERGRTGPSGGGGLLADLLYADEPRVIDDLDAIELAPDDPARPIFTRPAVGAGGTAVRAGHRPKPVRRHPHRATRLPPRAGAGNWCG